MKAIKWFGIGFGVLILLIVLKIAGTMWAFSTNMVADGVNTAYKEFKPSELLRKYEWFKDVSAQLDKKRANINVYNTRIVSLKTDYEGAKRSDWDRTDKETMSLWNQELAGVKASYNGLAAEYNSQMSKLNWRFTNVGDLPAGQTAVLPREHRTYANI